MIEPLDIFITDEIEFRRALLLRLESIDNDVEQLRIDAIPQTPVPDDVVGIRDNADAEVIGDNSHYIDFTDDGQVNVDKTNTTTMHFSLDSSAIDHGGLGGLSDDDHSQYILATGVRDINMSSGEFRIGNTTNYVEFKDDGELSLAGTARVTKRMWISANAIKAVGALAATETVNGNGYYILSFADNLVRRVQYTFSIPTDMDLSVDSWLGMGWSSPATSADTYINMYYFITAPGDSTDQAGTSDTGNILTSSGTADGLVVSPVVTISGGTIQSDEVCIHVILERDGTQGTDTLNDVLELQGVSLQYVSNKLGIAT